jgi:hypothetical protein
MQNHVKSMYKMKDKSKMRVIPVQDWRGHIILNPIPLVLLHCRDKSAQMK